ncbi:MAG: hypothetical protein IIC41_07110 [Candidatus Marinimicrobia bacterium]|nr:hypothetical protein [Candidatus Neomarinimicrobiota bacterium]
MFLLDTTGLAGEDTEVFRTYWPALLIGWGGWGILRKGFRLGLGSLIILALGVFLLLSNLRLWTWDVGQLWPVLLVLLGLAIIGRRGRPGRWLRRRIVRRGTASVSETVSGSDSGSSYVFSGGRERVTSQEYRGGTVSAICGGLELDLREARLGNSQVTLAVTVVCGGMEIKVPKDWMVHLQPSVALGSAELQRRQPKMEDASGEFIITGTVICGGVEVKN